MISLKRPVQFLWIQLFIFCLAPLCLYAADHQYAGIRYLDLLDVAHRLGMKYKSLQKGETAKVYSRWTDIFFKDKARFIELNGIKLYLGNALMLRSGKLCISQQDYELTLLPILMPQKFSPIPHLRRIVIDPGHGGKDPGAENHSLNLNEKSLCLDIAKRLKKILETRGYKVFLTRNDDTFIPLAKRPLIATQLNADLFISLHMNSTIKSSVYGIESFAFTLKNQPSTSRSKVQGSDKKRYYGNLNDPWNGLLAYYLQKSLLKKTGSSDRGVKRARFAVLKGIHCPGALLEMGFLSNLQEAKNLGWSTYRDRLAHAIADGISTYQKTLNRLNKK